MTELRTLVRRTSDCGPGRRFAEHVAARIAPKQRRYLRLRRIVETVVSATSLLVVAVPMAIISLGVLATMGRPILFTQERVTQDGHVFRLHKFRSMRHPSQCGTDDDAARIVPFGRFLRETSLDELPSLWNVVRGEMSLVGPRPLTVDYMMRYSSEQHARHAVPAGLTGLAQVSGRNALSWDRRLEIDLEYVRTFGLVLDLQILAATVAAVLGRHGVTDDDGVSMSSFPGPQSTSDLQLLGPDADGAWSCRDREHSALLHGVVRVLESGVVELESFHGPLDGTTRQSLLDDALLLLVSRLRVVHRADWAVVHSTAPSSSLAVALTRNGFVPVEAGDRVPSAHHPGSSFCSGTRCQVAFLGFPDDEGAPTLPSPAMPSR